MLNVAPYVPPRLNVRVTLRNPADRPARPSDALGRPTGPAPSWGVSVWAAREDRSPRTLVGDDGAVDEISVVWTIRHRAGVAANVNVVHAGKTYRSTGPAVRRGGAGDGRPARYLEIHTRLIV